jgi:hypothetical protein
MRRPHDRQARDFGPGPSLGGAESTPAAALAAANDNNKRAPTYSSALPSDAFAIIEPVSTSFNQSGRGRAGMWRLRMCERWSPHADPLTGWTGGGDPLGQIELRFPNVEAAERYCRREGIRFGLRAPSNSARPVIARLEGEARPRLCCWPTGPHAMCCGKFVNGGATSRATGLAIA